METTAKPSEYSGVSFGQRIFCRDLLITPGPEGRKIAFGEMKSVDDRESQALALSISSLDAQPPMNGCCFVDQTARRSSEVITLHPKPLKNQPQEDKANRLVDQTAGQSSKATSYSHSSSVTQSQEEIPLVDQTGKETSEIVIDFVRTVNGDEVMIKRTGVSEAKLVENKPIDNNGVIDVDFLKLLDFKVINQKLRKLKEKGEFQKASQLRVDSWMIGDLCNGADIPAERHDILLAIDRMMTFYLSDDLQDDTPQEKLEMMAIEESSESCGLMESSSDPKLSVVPIQEINDPPSEETLEPIPENINPTGGEVSSDDEFFDCLEVLPYDPIVDGFFD